MHSVFALIISTTLSLWQFTFSVKGQISGQQQEQQQGLQERPEC